MSIEAAFAAPRINPARRIVQLMLHKAADGTQLAQDPETGEQMTPASMSI